MKRHPQPFTERGVEVLTLNADVTQRLSKCAKNRGSVKVFGYESIRH